MNDLISRQALMDIFQQKADENTGLLRNNMLFAKKLVESMSTAYDVDKVAKQLKTKSFERYGNDGMGGELVINLDDVIEVLKGGGKDE